MSDGTIRVNIDGDTEPLENRLKKLPNTIQRTFQKISEKIQNATSDKVLASLQSQLDDLLAKSKDRLSREVTKWQDKADAAGEMYNKSADDFGVNSPEAKLWDSRQREAELQIEKIMEEEKTKQEKILDLKQQIVDKTNEAVEAEKKGSNNTVALQSINRAINRFKALGTAILGVSGVYGIFRRAVSAAISDNEELSNRISNIWRVLGAYLSGAIETVVNAIYRGLAFINAFIKALTGVDMLAKRNAAALNKQASATKAATRELAGFDEMNKLNDDNSSGSSGYGGGGTIDLPTLDPSEIAKAEALGRALKPIYEVLKWIFELILNNWQAILAAILAFKIVTWIQQIESFKAVLQGIGAWFSANWVALLVAAIVFLVVTIVTHWDEIKAFWNAHIKPAIDKAGQFIGGIINAVVEFLKSGALQTHGIWDKVSSWVMSIASKIGATIGTFITNAVNSIQSAKTAVAGAFSAIWASIQGVFSGVTQWFKDKFAAAWEAVKSVFSKGSTTFEGIKEGISTTFKGIVNLLIGGINRVIAAPFNALNGTLNNLRNKEILGIRPFQNMWGYNPIAVPQIPYLARGGVVVRPTQAVIGESGREAVLPLDQNTEWMDRLAEKINSNEKDLIVVVELDGKELTRKVIKRKKRLEFAGNGG